MPLPPGQPARRRAVGAGPHLPMPGFCVTEVRHSRQLSTRDFSIQWNEMGFTDVQDSADRYSFWPACTLFFYVADLPKKFPEVDGALHKLWQQTDQSAMKAENLDSTPISFTDEEAEWCKKSIESLQRLLTDAQREERGLSMGLCRTARTKKSAQETSDDSDLAPTLKVPRG